MAKMRQVNTFFWDDSYIENLKPNAKLLFIYLITSPLTNIAGSFEISLKKICDHTGLPRLKVEEILAGFEADEKFFYKNNWMLAANAIEHQDFGNPKIRKGIEIIISASPGWAIDRVCIAYSWLSHLQNRLSHLNLNSNTNTNTNNNTAADPGGKPPLCEIFFGKIESALTKRMGITTLPNQREWHQRVFEWAFANDFTPEAVLETYDLMKKGFWKNKSVSPKSLADNIPNLESLRGELGLTNGNGAIPQWQIDRDNCTLCDERGYIWKNDAHEVCTHDAE